MELGKKIRQLRFKAKLTQEQLAEKVGVGAQSVSKWETGAAMPDITTLPLIAEAFGVTIDDLFDLTVEARMNRIENRLDCESDIGQDVFLEFEEFLKSQLNDEQYKKRATGLIAYLYWHKMEALSKKVCKYAMDSVRLSPDEKGDQWMLSKARGDAVWDWNIANHSKAIGFYRELVEENPESRLCLSYLIDNLIADHRADEAEAYLEKYRASKDAKPVLAEVYRAYIALARFDEPGADAIMDNLAKEHGDDSVYLFEAAQYHARKCDYDRAIELYELSFEKETRRPRYIDELQGIADIYEIRGDYENAAKTYGRIVDLLTNEWGMTEDTGLADAKKEKARLEAKMK